MHIVNIIIDASLSVIPRIGCDHTSQYHQKPVGFHENHWDQFYWFTENSQSNLKFSKIWKKINNKLKIRVYFKIFGQTEFKYLK
jgi:hypothetical protein